MKLFNHKNLAFNWLVLIALLILGFVAYANCLGNEMFWDDDDFILKNRYIKDFSYWPFWFKENLVAGSYFVSNYWRPTLLYVFANEWHWFKDTVYGWHTVSVLWHIGTGFLTYWLFARLLNNRLIAFAIGVLFILHPVHNEAVVYVNSLGDSLATSFVLLGLIAYARFRFHNRHPFLTRSYWASLCCFILAVTSKETGFVLCALIPLMDIVLLQPKLTIPRRVLNTFKTIWPLLLMAITYVILRGTVLNFANSFNFYNENNEFTSNIFLRLLTFFKAMSQYTQFFFFPYELRVERQMPWATSLFQPDVLFGGAIVSLMIWSFFYYFKTKPLISFGVGWFFLAIAPASNVLVPINSLLYEHFLYAPMIGVLMILIYLGFTFSKSKRSLTILAIAIVAYAGFFIYKNVERNKDWSTAIGFYENLVTYSPSYRVINNLGMEYADKGIHDKAEFWYKKAIEMDPTNCVAYHNLGGTYRDTGRTTLAIDTFKKAIELNPRFIFSYRSLAQIYWSIGDLNQAYAYLKVVRDYDPTDANVAQAFNALTQELAKKNQ